MDAEQVEGEEIDFGFVVRLDFVAVDGMSGVDLVEAVASEFVAGFDLEAPAGVAVVDDGIVGIGIAKRSGDAQA